MSRVDDFQEISFAIIRIKIEQITDRYPLLSHKLKKKWNNLSKEEQDENRYLYKQAMLHLDRLLAQVPKWNANINFPLPNIVSMTLDPEFLAGFVKTTEINSNNPIYLLHGSDGCGKSSFVKYIFSVLSEQILLQHWHENIQNWKQDTISQRWESCMSFLEYTIASHPDIFILFEIEHAELLPNDINLKDRKKIIFVGTTSQPEQCVAFSNGVSIFIPPPNASFIEDLLTIAFLKQFRPLLDIMSSKSPYLPQVHRVLAEIKENSIQLAKRNTNLCTITTLLIPHMVGALRQMKHHWLEEGCWNTKPASSSSSSCQRTPPLSKDILLKKQPLTKEEILSINDHATCDDFQRFPVCSGQKSMDWKWCAEAHEKIIQMLRLILLS